MLQGKTIIVTGAASGIGAATAALVSSHGAEAISVDINAPEAPVGRFMQADLADRSSIDRLVAALPSGAHGLANIAGLPPTRTAEAVLKLNNRRLKPVGCVLRTESPDTRRLNDASRERCDYPTRNSLLCCAVRP